MRSNLTLTRRQANRALGLVIAAAGAAGTVTAAPASAATGATRTAPPDADITLAAQMSDAVTLALSTDVDYYRIPAITVAPNGDLLASYDERPLGDWRTQEVFLKRKWKVGGDSPNPNSIIQRRSTDNGATWGEPTVIHAGVETADMSQIEGYSDPSYVVDYTTGSLFNFHVKSYEAGLQEAVAGNDHANRQVIQVEVSTSTDNGYTWTHQTITSTVTPDPTVRWRFAASGQGIQILHGAYAGRLVQQFTLCHDGSTNQAAFSLYSDDHGATWTAGASVGTHMDENKVVERSDGTLLLNSRHKDGDGTRLTAVSTDGGATWTETGAAADLVDSKTNGQIIRAYPNAAPGTARSKVLLFVNTQYQIPTNNRFRGTVWASFDDGVTWPVKKVFREESTGYTTMAVQADGRIGLLTEDSDATHVKEAGVFYRVFSLAWLLGEMPEYVARVAQAGTGTVLMGDWDGDGVDTYAVRVGSRVVFYNENSRGAVPTASVTIGRATDTVRVGDWDGDGKDTLALVRGKSVYLQTTLTSSATTLGSVTDLESARDLLG